MDYQRNCNPIFVFSLWEANVFISSKKHTHQKNVQNITKHCRCSEMFQTKNTHTKEPDLINNNVYHSVAAAEHTIGKRVVSRW